MNAPFAVPVSGQMRRPGEELSTASANLPVAELIAACESVFDALRADAEQDWERHPQSHGIWQAEYGDKDAWLAAMVAERGPVKLHRLCQAARAAGETRVHIGAEEFWKIAPFYKAG